MVRASSFDRLDLDRSQTISEEVGERDSCNVVFDNSSHDRGQPSNFEKGPSMANTTSTQEGSGSKDERKQDHKVDCEARGNQGLSRTQKVRMSLFSCKKPKLLLIADDSSEDTDRDKRKSELDDNKLSEYSKILRATPNLLVLLNTRTYAGIERSPHLANKMLANVMRSGLCCPWQILSLTNTTPTVR